MTREQLNKHWDVIVAFKDGAEVEFYHPEEGWAEVDRPIFDIDFEYRIKPKPEYVPFDFSDAEFMIGKVVKSKGSNWICMITGCNESYLYSGETGYLYGELLHNFTFLDGSTCGKLKQ